MTSRLNKIAAIIQLTGQSLEMIMLLTNFNSIQLDAYHYMVVTCGQRR